MFVLLFALCCLLLSVHPRCGAQSSENAEQRADKILKEMTLDEKLAYIGGYKTWFIMPVERLGLPAIDMADDERGPSRHGPYLVYPAGIAMAATWNTELADKIGVSIGRDSRARGVHIILGGY